MTRQDDRKELTVTEKQTIEETRGEHTREGVMYVPAVDIFEDANSITLYADLPGVRREQVDIDIRDDVLSLTATTQPLPSHWRATHSEYEVGGFARRFTLGEHVDRDKIHATLEHGVLTLVLPKAEKHRPRKVEIR